MEYTTLQTLISQAYTLGYLIYFFSLLGSFIGLFFILTSIIKMSTTTQPLHIHQLSFFKTIYFFFDLLTLPVILLLISLPLHNPDFKFFFLNLPSSGSLYNIINLSFGTEFITFTSKIFIDGLSINFVLLTIFISYFCYSLCVNLNTKKKNFHSFSFISVALVDDSFNAITAADKALLLFITILALLCFYIYIGVAFFKTTVFNFTFKHLSFILKYSPFFILCCSISLSVWFNQQSNVALCEPTTVRIQIADPNAAIISTLPQTPVDNYKFVNPTNGVVFLGAKRTIIEGQEVFRLFWLSMKEASGEIIPKISKIPASVFYAQNTNFESLAPGSYNASFGNQYPPVPPVAEGGSGLGSTLGWDNVFTGLGVIALMLLLDRYAIGCLDLLITKYKFWKIPTRISNISDKYNEFIDGFTNLNTRFTQMYLKEAVAPGLENTLTGERLEFSYILTKDDYIYKYKDLKVDLNETIAQCEGFDRCCDTLLTGSRLLNKQLLTLKEHNLKILNDLRDMNKKMLAIEADPANWDGTLIVGCNTQEWVDNHPYYRDAMGDLWPFDADSLTISSWEWAARKGLYVFQHFKDFIADAGIMFYTRFADQSTYFAKICYIFCDLFCSF